jgi:hypothetical protein
MTDWKTLAAARCPDIPAETRANMVPALGSLEAVFRPMAARLTADDESALRFAVSEQGE